MAEGTILPYLDVPLQHASPSVLKAMKRPANTENMLRRIESWRTTCPDITLRSTFIVGFPGETEADFNLLLDFIKEIQFDRVGAFKYSAVEGAAANQLEHQVDEELKEERLAHLMETQSQISHDKLADKVGQPMRVIVDSIDNKGAIARGAADAPEVDGLVFIDDMTEGLSPGDFVDVKIIDHNEHDLWAELL